MGNPKTLEQFRNSGRDVNFADGLAEMGIDADYYEDSAVTGFRIYESQCYLETLSNEQFGLLIGRDWWQGNLAEMESRLYFEWYVSECASGEWNNDSLSRLLTEWCEWKGIISASADELLSDTLRNPPKDRTREELDSAVWLEWYIREWESAE